jgi:thioredoxin reductase (NADPH)
MAIDLLEQRREQMFPKLTSPQMARLEAHGKRIATRADEILLDRGDRTRRIFVVVSGSLELLLTGKTGEEAFNVLTSGDFSGEMSALRGSIGFVRIRVREGGIVIAIDAEQLRALVQTDAELSETFMRAFILRRMGLLASASGEVMLIGSRHSADTLRLQEFLTRNAFPYVNIDVDIDADVQDLLERFHVPIEDIPVVVCRGEHVFKNPSNHDVAQCLGMNPEVDDSIVHDLLIVGAGPAGLAAAVYAASEGLDVRIVETTAAGGQAGSSSKIENYLGFPTGISGQALAGRALSQSQKFGAIFSVASHAVKLHCDSRPYLLELEDGNTVRASIVIIASGAQYRTLNVENLTRFTGAGVYFAATHLEAKLCAGEEIVIVGGGNSAGQAAVFLAGSCRHVHILVRSSGLSESMSRYLIRRIEENPNISLHTHTQIAALEGNNRLERMTWRDADEHTEQHDIAHVFLMTGALPNTQWLQGCVTLDEHGFVKTGPDLHADELVTAKWPLPRTPYLLESSLPGVFAAGDVRSGSIKRVAAAVGEGSSCVQFVHRALRELSAPAQQRASVQV